MGWNGWLLAPARRIPDESIRSDSNERLFDYAGAGECVTKVGHFAKERSAHSQEERVESRDRDEFKDAPEQGALSLFDDDPDRLRLAVRLC